MSEEKDKLYKKLHKKSVKHAVLFYLSHDTITDEGPDETIFKFLLFHMIAEKNKYDDLLKGRNNRVLAVLKMLKKKYKHAHAIDNNTFRGACLYARMEMDRLIDKKKNMNKLCRCGW